MTNMTYEQLVATFGPEVAKQMQAQMTANIGGGNRAPFPFLKKVSTYGSELGNFGEFIYGTEKEKQADGTYAITNKGTNLGTSFEFIIVNVAYRFRQWDEEKQRNLFSNMFENVGDIKKAVDLKTGAPIEQSKEVRKKVGIKLVRVNAGLIRKDSKSAWEPVIWETDGKLYYSLGELIGARPNKGWLDTLIQISTKIESKGSTSFPVIDLTKSKCADLPKDLFTAAETKALISDITKKMTEWRDANQYSTTKSANHEPSSVEEDTEETPW